MTQCPLCRSERPIESSPEEVIRAICAARNMDVSFVRSARRTRRAVETRRIIARTLRNMGYTLSAIGGLIGNRHHASVAHLLASGEGDA